MVRGKKRISPHHTAQISILKGYILESNGRGFDGDGYPIREAIRQLRATGHVIQRNRKLAHWTLVSKPTSQDK